MTNRRWILAIGLIIGAAILFLGGIGEARAHAVLVFADPEPNAIVRNAPTEMWILFSEPVEPAFSQITVLAQSGRQIDNGDLTVANEDKTALMVTLPADLAPGTYLVSWRVLSSVDGHTTSGTFPFGVGIGEISASVGPATSSAQVPTLFGTSGRWLNLTGLVLLIGLVTFRLFVWRPVFAAVRPNEAESELDLNFGRFNLRLGTLGVVLLVSGAVFTFISQTGQYQLFTVENFQAWLGTRFGSMWIWRFGLTLAAYVGLVTLFGGLRKESEAIPEWRWWSGLGLAAGLALTISLVSHSAALTSQDASLAIAADFLHIVAAGIWGGGLLLLALALWLTRRLPGKSRAWLDWGLILNFSTLAATAVGVLLVSGGYLAWQHVGDWNALFGTAYGLTLVAKVALALPALGIAAINLLVVKPRLHATLDQPEAEVAAEVQVWFGRLVQVEALLAVLVLVAAGYLTDLQRGKDAPLLANEPTELVVEQAASDDLNVILRLKPALVGQNDFDVLLTDAGGTPILNASEVSLRFTFLGQSMGTATALARSDGTGHYEIEGGYLSLVGPWQIEVAVRRPNAFDAFAPFRLESGLTGAFRPIGQESFLEGLARFLTQSGGSVTGTLLILGAIGWAFLAGRASKRDWQLAPLLLPGFFAFWIGGLQLYTFFNEFTPSKFSTNPVLPDAGSISRGQALYEQNCVPCHGPEGRGDGPLANSFSPPPADFTTGHTDSHPDGDLFFWIKNGITNTGMPAFGEQFNDDDVWHLVNYVRRLSAEGAGP
jgi:copper transport protein